MGDCVVTSDGVLPGLWFRSLGLVGQLPELRPSARSTDGRLTRSNGADLLRGDLPQLPHSHDALRRAQLPGRRSVGGCRFSPRELEPAVGAAAAVLRVPLPHLRPSGPLRTRPIDPCLRAPAPRPHIPDRWTAVAPAAIGGGPIYSGAGPKNSSQLPSGSRVYTMFSCGSWMRATIGKRRRRSSCSHSSTFETRKPRWSNSVPRRNGS